MNRHFLVAVLALAVGTTAVHAGQPSKAPLGPQASIPFANLTSSIRDWQANENDGLWVQDARRQWYYAELMGPCWGLDYALQVGFNTRGASSFDRFSEVVVPGYDRCAVRSFTRSDAPPVKQGKDAKKGKAAEVSADAEASLKT